MTAFLFWPPARSDASHCNAPLKPVATSPLPPIITRQHHTCTMEPPAKRRKKSQGLAEVDDDDDDELFLAPEELNQKRDPAYQLARKRDLAANKLKFRFQNIFEKYGKDFTGIGDEISNATGEVLVDNGHLRSLRDARDFDDGQDDEDENSSEENERVLRGGNAARDLSPPDTSSQSTFSRDPWQVAGSSRPGFAMEESGLLITSISDRSSFASSSRPYSSFDFGGHTAVDPAWQTPYLPDSAFYPGIGGHGRQLGFGIASYTPTRTVIKKMPPAPPGPDADEEDVLLGVTTRVLKNNDQESPLIKEKFPVIDSPNEDPEQTGRIMDLIENSPPTPSSSIQRPRVAKRRGRPSKLRETLAAGSETDSKEKPRRRSGRPGKETNVDGAALAAVDATILGLEDKEVRATRHGQPLWADSDVEGSKDVTSFGFKKPRGQVLYVDIRTTKGDSSELSGGDDHGIWGTGVSEEASTKDENTSAETSNQAPRRLRRYDLLPNPCKQSAAPGNHAETSAASIKNSEPQEKWKRNVVDPAFEFSDEETLLPKRASKRSRQSQPTTIPGAVPSEKRDAIVELCRHEAEQDVERKAMETLDADVVEGRNLQPIGSTTSTRYPNRQEGEQQETKVANAQATTAFERNTVDPSYTFSDEEIMLTRKTKHGTRRSEPMSLTGSPSGETSAVDVEPLSKCGIFETSRKRRSTRISSKPFIVSTPADQDETTVDTSNAADEQPIRYEQQAEVPILQEPNLERRPREQGVEQRLPDVSLSASRPRARGRPRRKTNDGNTMLQSPRLLSRTEPASEAGFEVATPQSRQKSVGSSSAKRSSVRRERSEPSKDTDGNLKRLCLRSRSRRRSAQQQQPSPELGDSSLTNLAPAVNPAHSRPHSDTPLKESTTADMAKPGPGQSSSKTVKSTSTGSAPGPYPLTPQAKSKGSTNKTINADSAKSLIALLSDHDDSEDEISFDLADFTPSGHHRIVVHRPFFPGLTTTPSFSSIKSTTKKQEKKRPHLPFELTTHSSDSKFKTPHSDNIAPGSASSSTQRTRRSGHRRASLARSVVRVNHVRDNDSFGGSGSRTASPRGEVVHTPGGTKRQCGEDGFFCNRDFCFVCL